MYYFGHNLEAWLSNAKSRKWYRCKVCNIEFYYSDYFKQFYYDNFPIKAITCNDFIIKSILE